MKLLLLSNTRTNENEDILNLISTLLTSNSRIGYIPSAPDSERKYLKETELWFSKTGNTYTFDYLDIHNKKYLSLNDIKSYDGFFISGGNTYSLITALRNSGMTETLKQVARDCEKPIIGVSAGGIVLTPDIRTATSENESGITDHSGLNLISFGFYPHFDLNNQSESKEIEVYKKTTGISQVYAVPDTSAIYVIGSEIVTIGNVYKK